MKEFWIKDGQGGYSHVVPVKGGYMDYDDYMNGLPNPILNPRAYAILKGLSRGAFEITRDASGDLSVSRSNFEITRDPSGDLSGSGKGIEITRDPSGDISLRRKF